MTTLRAFLSHTKHDESQADKILAILKQQVPTLEVRHYRDPNLAHHPTKPESDKYLQDVEVFIILHSSHYENSRPSMREFQNGYHRDVKQDIEMVIVKLDDTPLPSIAQGRTYFQLSDPQLGARLAQAVQEAALRVVGYRTASASATTPQVQPLPSPTAVSARRDNRRNPDALWRGSTEHIHSLVDWTVHIHPSGYRWRDEAFKDIAQKRLRVVPAKLLYTSYDGTRAWMSTCARDEYCFYTDSLELLRSRIDKILERAVSLSGDPEFDYISLGCGNGIKDSCILEAMLRHLHKRPSNEFIYYYPVDISPYMLMQATINIFRDGIDALSSQRTRVKGVWGDFSYLHAFTPIYEEFRGNNFLAILGNTLGNEGEHEVLAAVQEGLFSGDFLLVEYNADKDALRHSKHFSHPDNIDRHWQAVLRLDPKATSDKRSARELSRGDISKSYIAERTFMTFATDVRFPKLRHQPLKELGLGLLHCYDKSRLADEFVQLGFEILSNDVEKGVGLLFARKT